MLVFFSAFGSEEYLVIPSSQLYGEAERGAVVGIVRIRIVLLGE